VNLAFYGLVTTAVLYAVFLIIGWLAARRLRAGSADDFIVAGRAMPLWIATMTMTATWVDGGYLLGTAEYTYKYGLTMGIQGGVCFGMSLFVGGLLFAGRMRRHEFSTMVDPFEARFGKVWAAVLSIPAMLGELFWSGALLVALGSTFGLLLDMDLTTAIIVSAVVVTLYTLIGGMWSVAYTDAFQLLLIPLGLLIALPWVLPKVGGFQQCLQAFTAGRPDALFLAPPAHADAAWTRPGIIAWWDMTIMLVLGGIPWNCYFQRVLACQTPAKARWHSIFAGVLTTLLTFPPALLGMAAFAYWGPDKVSPASEVLPRVFRELTPGWVVLLGLAAILGAVTSSFSSSILSAGSMIGWNVVYRLLRPDLSVGSLKLIIRVSILLLGVVATFMAMRVQSVAALWLFTGDLVFVLLFPQLLYALFDAKANRTGSMVAFAVSLALRLGGGISLETNDGSIGFPALLRLPEWFPGLFPGSPTDWYEANGAASYPIRTMAAAAGMILLPLVSRLTARLDPPRPLRDVGRDDRIKGVAAN
jgi:high affinity choline transporter 7